MHTHSNLQFEKLSKQELKLLLEEHHHHQNFLKSHKIKEQEKTKYIATPDRRLCHDRELLALRDQMSEAKPEDMASLLSEMNRLAALKNSDAPQLSVAIDKQKPYFAHLKLQEIVTKKFNVAKSNSETTIIRDILIGNTNYIDRQHNIVIVDWRHAPVSQIYYRYAEDEEYEDERADEIREGLVLARRTIAFRDGQLARVQTPKGVYRLTNNNPSHNNKQAHYWKFFDLKQEHALAGGAGSSPRTLGCDRIQWRESRTLENISALIAPDQFAAMSQKNSGIVVLQGGAGSGKTTVALHRVSYLKYQNPEKFRNNRILCLVRQRSLVPYLKHLMPSLGLEGCQVICYDDWAKQQVKELLNLHHFAVTDDAPEAVSLYKKHPALLKAIADRMLSIPKACIQDFKNIAARSPKEYKTQLNSFIFRLSHSKTSLSFFFNEAQRQIKALQISFDLRERLSKILKSYESSTLSWQIQWQYFLCDPTMKDYLCTAYKGAKALTAAEFKSAQQWHTLQVESNLKAEITNENPEQQQKKPIFYNFENNDLHLLINIHLAIYGTLFSPKTRKVRGYDHIVIDEAQDLSAIELKPLIVAAGKAQSISLAGDIVQKVVFDNGFLKWKDLIEQLECKATEVKPFRLSYRSSKQITEFAHAILGPLAPVKPPKTTREGKDVCVFRFEEQGQETEFIARALRELMRREPNCSVAILCRYPERAEHFFEQLQKTQIPKLALRLYQDFSFKAGIEISTIIMAKGLEFDYVICPEMTDQMYPENSPSRHLLHIASTRAAYQFWGTTTTKKSLLISEKYIVRQD